jgi:hypothetical protein
MGIHAHPLIFLILDLTLLLFVQLSHEILKSCTFVSFH